MRVSKLKLTTIVNVTVNIPLAPSTDKYTIAVELYDDNHNTSFPVWISEPYDTKPGFDEEQRIEQNALAALAALIGDKMRAEEGK